MGLHNLKRPCHECPFSRKCLPKEHLGGAEPTVFIGQAFGPFVLSCHTDENYEQKTALQNHAQLRGCAGMAIYRANNGYDKRMPDAIYSLPENRELVFSSPAEFLAHHTAMTIEEAEQFMKAHPDWSWFKIELAKLTEKNIINSKL